MKGCAGFLTAASLTLATSSVWAFSPNDGRTPWPRTPAPRGLYPYPLLPVAAYPVPGYRANAAAYPRGPWPTARQTGRPAAVRPTHPGRPAQTPTAAPAKPVPSPAAGPENVTAGSQPPAGSDAQAAFFAELQPLVARENARLAALRDEVAGLVETIDNGGTLRKAHRQRLGELARRYRVEGDPVASPEARRELLRKVDIVPVSLALAQAANESAWGKSRFAREGNNLFGIWTYDERQGIVPRKRSPGKKHLVRRFDSVADSVRYYMHTLNSHPAYAELRAIRAGLREDGRSPDGHSLADGLTRYSAKGKDYVHTIRAMIRRFDLAAFDAAPDREA